MRISDWSSDVCSSDLGKPALQALGREATSVLGGDEGAQLLRLQGFEIDDALGLRPFRQRGEVAAVGVERVRGHAALDLEVGEVVCDNRRPEGRRVGQEWGRKCRSRGAPDNEKK